MPRYPYFPESPLAHRYIDPLQPGPGLELGGSRHNDWGIPNTINVDYTDDMTTPYKLAEIEFCGQTLPVDVVAYADDLPFEDSSQSWVISSHVLEHLPNAIGAHIEWWRVVKNGGIIFTHIPKRDAHPPDIERPISTLEMLMWDHANQYTLDTHPIENGVACRGGHYHVWDVPLYLSMIEFMNRPAGRIFDVLDWLETDDKVGNSHAFVLRVIK